MIINKPYGGNGKAFSHHIYRIWDGWEKRGFFLAARIQYKCYEQDPIFIPQVHLIRIYDKGDTDLNETYRFPLPDHTLVEIKYDKEKRRSTTQLLKAWNTPENLCNQVLGAYPYMWSVNTTDQYFNLMAKLSEKFGDRALAGFFLSEFNRSCKKADRKNESLCNAHSYK
jgi:hypothetical protein